MNLSHEPHPRVMIVDDTPANLAFLSDALADAGYEVLVALNGQTALRQLDEVRPDLILLDAVMPGLDGFETCDRLKARPDTREIPVIFMTALADTADVVRGFDRGAVDYVTKPVREAEVLARIASHLERSRDLRRAHGTVEALPRPCLTVTPTGIVTTLSGRAREWLTPLCPGARVDDELLSWLAGQRGGAEPAPLRRVDPAGELVFEYCGTLDDSEVLVMLDRLPASPAATLAAAWALTPREAEVLHWVAAGKTNRDIARILDISPRTVTKHLEHVFVKLGVETRTAAAARALALAERRPS